MSLSTFKDTAAGINTYGENDIDGGVGIADAPWMSSGVNDSLELRGKATYDSQLKFNELFLALDRACARESWTQ